MHIDRAAGMLLACLLLLTTIVSAQNVTPHAQDRPPGPALSPQEAMAKMQLPPGFRAASIGFGRGWDR